MSPVGSAVAADWYTGAERVSAPADNWIAAVDAAATVTSNSSAFGAVTGTVAPFGTLLESGPRLRVQGVAGTYTYPGPAGTARVRGVQEEGTVLTGYEWIWRDAAVAGYIGFNVRHNELSIPDPRNPVVGTGVGAKVAADIYIAPTTETMFQANASYSTLFRAYYGRVKAGYMVGNGIYVGPEVTLLGDAFFNQWRVGAHLTGFSLGPMKFSFGAGYAFDRVQKGGYYTSIEGRAVF